MLILLGFKEQERVFSHHLLGLGIFHPLLFIRICHWQLVMLILGFNEQARVFSQHFWVWHFFFS
jgi:hypothetical protein